MKTACKPLSAVVILSMAGVLHLSCNKKSNTNDSGNTSGSGTGIGRLELRLTDGPATYDAVYIDIQKAEVNVSSDTATQAGWQELPVLRPRVYNLLHFSNGVDTLLAATDMPAGTLAQIRLILGNNNSVVVKGQSYPLTTPSGQQSGIKLSIHAVLTASIVYRLWIDFDASRSIVAAGNSGKYMLKPVIRAYSEATGGSIKGFALPSAATPLVWTAQGADTLFALPDTATGYYFIGGVNAGSWNMMIHSQDPAYKDTAFAVSVTTGAVTNAGTVTLH